MFHKISKKSIYPDPHSWLSEFLINFFKTFKNEYLLTLWDALNEYVAFHNPYCAYKGMDSEGPVELYPLLDYDRDARKATLKKLFFVSKPAQTILKHDYLDSPPEKIPTTSLLKFLNLKKKKQEEGGGTKEYPEIEFMIMHNNMEPPLAREILLKTSHNRRAMQKVFVFENEASGISYENIDITNIDFDLKLLEDCKFFNAKRYETFKLLLPVDLVVNIAVKLNYRLPQIPDQLKEQQLLDVSSVEN